MNKKVKYTEPSNYFSKEALKIFNTKEDEKADNKKKDEERKRENEELRNIFKGK